MLTRNIELLKMAIISKLAYKFDTFIWAVSGVIFLLVQIYLWKAIFSYTGQELIKGFTYNMMIMYYFLNAIVGTLTYSWVDYALSDDVRVGTLSQKLIRPITYLRYQFLQFLGDRIFSSLEFIPTIILAIFLVNFIWPASAFAILFVISLIFAMILTFLFTFLFGLSAFWLKRAGGLRVIKQGLLHFLSGGVIPLSFFPAAFGTVFAILPFQYTRYVPIQIFLQNITFAEAIRLMLIQAVWCVIIFGLISVIWAKARRTFSGVGI